MNSKKITEVGDPVNINDATNKKYVDEKVIDFSSHITLESNAIKFMKPLDANSKSISGLPTPINSSDVATKEYIDSQFIGYAKVIPFRYFSNGNVVLDPTKKTEHTLSLTGINIPSIQHSTQVYVTASLRNINLKAFHYVDKKVVTGPRGGPNKVNLKFRLSLLPQKSTSSATIGYAVKIIIDGFIIIGPRTSLDYLPPLDYGNPDVFPDSDTQDFESQDFVSQDFETHDFESQDSETQVSESQDSESHDFETQVSESQNSESQVSESQNSKAPRTYILTPEARRALF